MKPLPPRGRRISSRPSRSSRRSVFCRSRPEWYGARHPSRSHRAVLPAPSRGRRAPSDFEHFAKDRDHVENLIKGRPKAANGDQHPPLRPTGKRRCAAPGRRCHAEASPWPYAGCPIGPSPPSHSSISIPPPKPTLLLGLSACEISRQCHLDYNRGPCPLDKGPTGRRAGICLEFVSKSVSGMAKSTRIEWTGSTWNPITRCTKITRGHDFCYAERLAERFRSLVGPPFERGFHLTRRPERLVPLVAVN